ncbi:MAG TPA: TlpA disulfide reductase family protein [Kofleriaceae bacterium]
MTFVERIGLAVIRPKSALAIAGERDHAGRSGSDLLLVIIAVVLATQLRALVAAGWLGFAVDGSLGVRALVQTLTDALVVDLGFLVVGAAIIYVAAGAKRDLGRAFDLSCVAALPLLLVDLAASVVVYAGELSVPRTIMWALSLISYAWTGGLIALACVEARRAARSEINAASGRRAGWGVLALVLVGIAVQVVWIARHMDLVKPMTAGDPAPAIALRRITGKTQLGETVSITPGKVTVIDFWATWCGPCLKAMPHLDALARAHPEVAVLAVNLDDPAEAWDIFHERNYVMTLLAGDRETSDRYGVAAIPHTVVIDRAGNVRRVFRGGAMNLEREVQALLK